MYSLYRAWLTTMSGNSAAPPTPPSLNLPPATTTSNNNTPDVQLQVGPALTNFSAHRNVLAAHSGFFKAALSTLTAGPILVPNIQVDEFSALLTFMYTGYLDLNFANIYNILLATHILHMPRALDLCRNFLMHAQQQQQQPDIISTHATTSSVIKPIASRKPLEPFQSDATTTSDGVPCISETSAFRKITASSVANDTDHKSPSPPPAPSIAISATCAKKSKKKASMKCIAPPPREVATDAHVPPPAGDRVIIDIACCDGPVRFHRVLNKNYGQPETMTAPPPPPVAAAAPPPPTTSTCASMKRTLISEQQAMNKAMSATIASDSKSPPELFTCLYCNHTFKSQYCYQKHARRHLNPVDGDDGGAGSAPTAQRKRGEFQLLDMNVQYYPCKTCGSKFPSYYFVHKHRKLCHADEMADGSNKNNEIVQVKPPPPPPATTTTTKENEDATMSGSSGCPSDIIDVEDTNDV